MRHPFKEHFDAMFRGAGALVPMDEGSLARKTQQDDI